jgi:hypothetical protein
MRVIALCSALLLSMTTGAHAALYVVSGKPLRIYFAYSVNPDCTPTGEITARVTQSPQHGQAYIARAQEFPNFPAVNVRSACNRRRVSGVLIRYISERGFVGADYIGLELIYPGGLLRRGTFTIDVR